MNNTQLAHFMSFMDEPTPCILWTHAQNNNGYGIIRQGKITPKVHRVIYEHFYGPIPEGLSVLHKCPGKKNRNCISPFHLKAGDYFENAQDSIDDGTWTHGEQFWSAKLKEAQVMEIRTRYSNGESQPKLAKEFGVTQTNISRIVKGKTWKHLPIITQIVL
jgi:hypothetical protein